jgi:HEAT repeat protein
LIEAFHDEPVREAAVEAVVQIGKPALPALIDALTDNDRRLDVAQALRRIDAPAAGLAGVDKTTTADLPALVRALSNKERSEEARRAAAAALGQLGKAAEAALEPLIEGLGDAAIRPSVASALGKIGRPAVPALVAKLQDRDAGVREFAAVALGHGGPDAQDAMPALIEALRDRDREVRRAAGLALERIGPDSDKAVPALIAVLRSNDAEPVRQAAIKALVRASPEAKPAIVAALLATIKENNNYGVRMLAEWGLKKVDPAAADKAGVR